MRPTSQALKTASALVAGASAFFLKLADVEGTVAVMPPDLRDPRQMAAADGGPRRTGSLMSQDLHRVRRRVEITNPYGLHLRPAEKFVGLAGQFRADVRVRYEGRDCNGKSILDLMTLAAECGSWLELEAQGPDAEAAVSALVELVATHFGEKTSSEDSPVQPPEADASPPEGLHP
ncbi:HPr family phosphocarrier protein [Tautonia marina]|uniref:HPr family phosphocarrier protein n=1 Tax=Tautonia marina TaxID=2653855 RepID=UPI001F1B8537|nr:HPr family phosphocarrier protein [Tautonia marina]